MMKLAAGLLLAAPLLAQAPLDAPGRISLDLIDTDVRDALRLVAKQGGLNMVMSNAVSGTVTLELHDVSIDEALRAVLSVGGFQHTLEGGIVTVLTHDELVAQAQQRETYRQSVLEAPALREVLVLELRYVDAERVQPVIEGLLGEGGTVSMLQTTDHLRQAGAGTRTGSTTEEEGLQIGTQLSTSSRGLPAKSHTLVVVDHPERLALVEEVVARIDVKPIQVLIEARFVEVALDDARRMGVDWRLAASASGAGAPHTFPFGETSFGEYNPYVNRVSPGGLFPEAPDSISSPTDAGLFTFGTLDFSSFAAVLQLIERDSSIELVSNPSVVVGDRHTATILVGERYPILSANVSEFGSVTEQLDRYEPIGVQLEVTPSVLGEDEIELIVRPSTSSLGPLVKGSTGISVARINSRQIDTTVSVKDRQTVALGGLFTTRETRDTSRVPVLGSLPVLEHLFSYDSRSTERVDLVVFLTVAIVGEQGLTDAQREMFERAATGTPTLVPPAERQSLGYVPSPPLF